MKNLFLCIMSLIFLHFPMQAQKMPKPRKGEINLSTWNFEQTGLVELTGEWEFYWHELLNPENFTKKADSAQRVFVDVPGNWNSYSLNNKKILAYGYGTYHLKVWVKGNPVLFIKIMSISSAYKIWANKEFLGEVGKVDTTKANYKPEYRPALFALKTKNDFPADSIHGINILIQAANYYHVNSGIWEIVEIGDLQSFRGETKRQLIINALIVGILLVIAFYYFVLFLLHRDERSTIYLSLFALTMTLRSISVDNRIILDLIPHLNYFALIRIEYLSAYINIIFVALFFYNLFKKQHSKKIINVIVGLGIIAGLIILFSSVQFFTGLRNVFNLYVIVSSSYIAYYSLFKALLNKETGSIAAYIGMFVLLGTAIMDIITTVAVLPLPQIAPAGLVFYVLIQAIVLAQRFSKALNENKYLNKHLESIVVEKTHELKEEKEELQAAEEELRQNNEELLVLNENIVQQKEALNQAYIGLQGQAAMAQILQRVTDTSITLNEFLQFALDSTIKQPWLNIVNKGSIFITNSEGNLKMVAERDLGVLTKTCAIIKPGQCLCGKALKEKKLLFHDCVDEAHEIRPTGMKAHGHYNVPLLFEDRVVGVLNLYVEHGHKQTAKEKSFLTTLAGVLASVIQRRQIQTALDMQTSKLFQQNKELTTLKETIEGKEQQLQRIIENQGEGFILIDLKGNVTYSNTSALEILRIDKEAILTKNLIHFFNEDRLSELRKKTENLEKYQKYSFEELAQTANKDLIFIQATITSNYNNSDKKIGYIINFRDITVLKKNEEKLKNANIALKKYYVALEQSPLTIVITNTKAQMEYVNPAFTKTSGYSLGEMKITPRLLKSGKTPIETYKNMWETIRAGKIWKGEFINKKRNGQEYIERAVIAPIKNTTGNIINYVAIKEDITQRRRNEQKLKEQHILIEKAFRNINDSINYARTLQKSLLNKNKLQELFKDKYSLLFIPRDKVSGDFFYVNKILKWLIFAVGDCTGHGVPGAFLSVMSYSFIDEIVRNSEVNNPAQALELLRSRIKQTFANGTKDGLDIALCAIDTQKNTLLYAGAYNPLVIIRGAELIETKATYNPIGHYRQEHPFELHQIALEAKDRIYLFSDGFVDQFGGERNRKFMRKRFYNVLQELTEIPINEQSEILREIFTKWRGANEQIDDVSVLGIEW